MSELQPIERAFDYLWSVAGPGAAVARVSVAVFDDDHAPIGPLLRVQMERQGWIYYENGKVVADRPPREFWSAPCPDCKEEDDG